MFIPELNKILLMFGYFVFLWLRFLVFVVIFCSLFYSSFLLFKYFGWISCPLLLCWHVICNLIDLLLNKQQLTVAIMRCLYNQYICFLNVQEKVPRGTVHVGKRIREQHWFVEFFILLLCRW